MLPLTSYLQSIERGIESGTYRQTLALVEEALSYYPQSAPLKLWQAIATEAMGDTSRAIVLAQGLLRHPQLEIRQQARSLVGIWQAPKLKRPAAWLSEIPDLTQLPDTDSWNQSRAAPRPYRPPRKTPSLAERTVLPPPTGTYEVIWIALGVVILGSAAFIVLNGALS